MNIKATGTKNGKTVKVEYLDKEFLFNGEYNSEYEKEILKEMSRRHPFGGTYYPEEKSDINILNVIENYFFDKPVFADAEGDDIPELENVQGRVY